MSMKKQASQVNQFTRHVSFCKSIPSGTTLSAAQLRLVEIKKLYEEFQSNQSAIEETLPDERQNESYVVREQVEEYYFSCCSNLQEAINRANDAKLLTGQQQSSNKSQEIKLPRVELTPFSGKYEDWTSFRDLYTSMIHDNKGIPNVQKLHYLKNIVEGDAEGLLKSITVTEANYAEAWKILTETYDHKRFIVDSLLKNFFGQFKILKENHEDIKQLNNKSAEIIQSLKLQGIPVQHWDVIIVHVMVSKLDSETHRQWGLIQSKSDLPKYKDLFEFLRTRWQSLEMIVPDDNVNVQNNKQMMNFSNKNRVSHSANQSVQSSAKCFYCNEIHKIIICPKYNILNTSDKINFLKSHRLCFNCLSSGHSSADCNSAGRCKFCKSKHHTSIHTEIRSSAQNATVSQQSQANSSQHKDGKVTVTAVSASESSKKRVLLATAIVFVYTSKGEKYPAKALIDLGSDNSIIEEKLASKLGLQSEPDNTPIRGLGDEEVPTQNSIVRFKFSSHIDQSFTMEVEASKMNKITGALPLVPIHRENWPHLNGIKLADPHFDCPSPVEILFGADIFEEILLDGLVPKKDSSPTAMNSRLGWLLFGVVKSKPKIDPADLSRKCLIARKEENLDKILRTFWEIEEIPEKRKLTVKEQQAENIFVESVHRNNEGRYVVALPFDQEKDSLEIGESKKAAMASLFRMENRFKMDSQLKERYKEYITNLIQADHIELVPQNRMHLEDKDKFYLPHHAVLKEESITTKLRVVFDASRKSSSGVSLNDKLLVGPRIQEELYSILIRWRLYQFVFLADVEKMYRQVKLTEDHRDFQRLLWRFNENEPISEYRITTVIDGTASASYLATRTLNQLADDNAVEFPEASKIIREDFYVDDISSGSHSVKKCKQLQNEIIEIMNRGKFVLRKWYSNNKEILENVPVENRHDQSSLVEIIEKTIKTLGVYWNQSMDTFEFKITPCSEKQRLTKRELLSDISKIFDPIGWLAPSTIIAKIFMQSLWSVKGLDWDHKLPEEKMFLWRKYREQLHLLENIKIPRWIGTEEIVQLQLHGFGDASNSAYSAVVYARVVMSNGSISVKILSAKTKVSPVKVISTPKLELCASVLLARLMNKVKESLKLSNLPTFLYSDNTTVLAWLNSHPNHYNIFVANRITEVQTLTNEKNWSFVATEDNPADCASRGVYPSELIDHSLWWTGPKWLVKHQNEWPSYEKNYDTDEEKRKLPINALFASKVPEDDFLVKVLHKHSTLARLLRNTAKFINIFRFLKVKSPKDLGQPTAQELREALRNWIRYIQLLSFRDEVERCKSGDELLMKSRLRKLRPFLEEHGILRVGGRISKSPLPFKSKHPIILPKNNHFTKLILEQAHTYTLHGGPTLMSTFLTEYWIFGRTDQIKRTINHRVICFPHRCKPTEQIMADLPVNRVTGHRAFLHSGVDFAGPFITKTYTGRSRGKHANPTVKSYVAIFVCLATKAVHIDLVSSSDSSAFIACFKRFVARRGKCSDMYSDNGKNFVKSNRELREHLKKLMKDPSLQEFLAHDGTNWHFNPPAGPSFGGLWEAGVKSIKYHLKRLLGNNTFTFEELTTLLYQIEACLNSRPLCAISNDVNDVSYLTPGHFLIGEAPIAVPEPSLLDENITRLSRWKLIQRLYQEFWRLWYTEYLSRLQQRPKWLKNKENVQVGQLVLLREEDVPPAKWPVARILKVYPGDDGMVRVVKLEKYKVSIKPPIPSDFKKY